jgi:hypothetical protein
MLAALCFAALASLVAALRAERPGPPAALAGRGEQTKQFT